MPTKNVGIMFCVGARPTLFMYSVSSTYLGLKCLFISELPKRQDV